MILNEDRIKAGGNFYVIRTGGDDKYPRQQRCYTATVLAVIGFVVIYEWSQITGRQISKSHLELTLLGNDANEDKVNPGLNYLALPRNVVQAIADQGQSWDACIFSSVTVDPITKHKSLHCVHMKSPKAILSYWDYYSNKLPEYAREGHKPWLTGYTAVTTSKTWRL